MMLLSLAVTLPEIFLDQLHLESREDIARYILYFLLRDNSIARDLEERY